MTPVDFIPPGIAIPLAMLITAAYLLLVRLQNSRDNNETPAERITTEPTVLGYDQAGALIVQLPTRQEHSA